jgi:hypothetical protein
MNTNKRTEAKKFVDDVKIQNTNYKKYENKVSEIKETYTHLMNDYNSYADMVINSPNNVEYTQMYSNVKKNIQNIFSSLFEMSNKIDDENEDVLNNMNQVELLLLDEKQLNLELEEQANSSGINERSSTTLKGDYTKINYQEFYVLLSLIFSIIFVVIVICIINKYYTNTI